MDQESLKMEAYKNYLERRCNIGAFTIDSLLSPTKKPPSPSISPTPNQEAREPGQPELTRIATPQTGLAVGFPGLESNFGAFPPFSGSGPPPQTNLIFPPPPPLPAPPPGHPGLGPFPGLGLVYPPTEPFLSQMLLSLSQRHQQQILAVAAAAAHHQNRQDEPDTTNHEPGRKIKNLSVSNTVAQ